MIMFFKEKKRLLSLVFAIMMAFLLCQGFSREVEAAGKTTLNVHISGGNFGGDVKTDLAFDPAWIASPEKSKYNKELATLCSVLSAAIYPNVTTETLGKPGVEGILKGFGFKNIVTAEAESLDKKDTDDSARFIIGQRTDSIKGKKYDIYTVIIEGTDGSDSQWNSNLDVGRWSTRSSVLHPDWKEKNNHKGFDVTATRVSRILDDYISSHKRNGAEQRILFTGHSRGGAIANILGSRYSDVSIAYTYSSPNTTKISDAGKFTNIYNFLDSNDWVARLPLYRMGYLRFGTDIKYDIASDSRFIEKIKEYGGTYSTFDSARTLDDMFFAGHYVICTYLMTKMLPHE